jgi:hypothetical protein
LNLKLFDYAFALYGNAPYGLAHFLGDHLKIQVPWLQCAVRGDLGEQCPEPAPGTFNCQIAAR